MKITCWGTRGSIPTPGKNINSYGGNTTCYEIVTDRNELIIIDAGSGIRVLGKKILSDESIKEIYLLLTHAHWDHLMGFPFFTPAYLSKYKIYLSSGNYHCKRIIKFLKHQMENPYFPVPFNKLKAKIKVKNDISSLLNSSSMKIIPIRLNHPDGGFGFKFIENGKVFVFLTDNELGFHHKKGPSFNDFVGFCKDADLLIHDAQYTKKEYESTIGWGHSTFENCIKLAVKANVKSVGFCHHDPDRSDGQLDRIVDIYRSRLKTKGLSLNCFAVKEGSNIEL